MPACVECVCFAGDKVEELNVLAVLYGNEKRADSRAELFVKLVKYFFKVCVGVVALVYEESAGNLSFLSLVPCDFRAHFNACFSVEGDNSRVSHTYSRVNFARKIKKAGVSIKFILEVSHITGASESVRENPRLISSGS